ncbi:protein HYPER-SENSITIVITY-RELATED 4-like [Vigna unguiculata]|nr:protein HYPER-SENSITIVITY-RELATED 4-like [Vigna unguiculata]
MTSRSRHVSLLMDGNDEITDSFNGVPFRWRLVSRLGKSNYAVHFFEVRFHKKHREMVLAEYFPRVMKEADAARERRKTLRLFTVKDMRFRMGGRGESWQGVNLEHPATFATVAMDWELKEMIIRDLDRFVERKGLYKSVGKAWKRGYLLSGPPGTGKSSLIAAMANYLNFDVYDLELAAVNGNSDLRRLLIATGNRSILVVEDIDCSLHLQDRLAKPKPKSSQPHHFIPHHFSAPQVTLSGFLNFIDGLWSSCGNERIVVFTTNHKEKLDPALLRPGRMDVHIDMTYCTPGGFKMLASNYLGITEHPLFVQIENLLGVIDVTPAEVGEQFLLDEDPDIALNSLMELLLEKKRNHELKMKAPLTFQ